MGLEEVEFVLALEQALGIEIPDVDTPSIRSPRQLIGYLENRLLPGRWSRDELERVVEGLLLDACGHANFTLDSEFRDIFP